MLFLFFFIPKITDKWWLRICVFAIAYLFACKYAKNERFLQRVVT